MPFFSPFLFNFLSGAILQPALHLCEQAEHDGQISFAGYDNMDRHVVFHTPEQALVLQLV